VQPHSHSPTLLLLQYPTLPSLTHVHVSSTSSHFQTQS
jgi:hypothetical protein